MEELKKNEDHIKKFAVLIVIICFVIMCRTLDGRSSHGIIHSQSQGNGLFDTISEQWMDEKKNLWRPGRNIKLMIFGKPGSGKSVLINGMLDRKVDGGDTTTNSIVSKTLNINEVPVAITVWDFGLYNGKIDEDIKKMKDKIKMVDLIFYAMKMDDTRIRPEDTEPLRKLSRAFGHHLWERTLFVLTFANEVVYLDNRQQMRRSREHVLKRSNQWKSQINEVLEDEGISSEVLEKMPFVPVGHPAEPKLFDDDESWTFQLSRYISLRMKEDVRPAILRVMSKQWLIN